MNSNQIKCFHHLILSYFLLKWYNLASKCELYRFYKNASYLEVLGNSNTNEPVKSNLYLLENFLVKHQKPLSLVYSLLKAVRKSWRDEDLQEERLHDTEGSFSEVISGKRQKLVPWFSFSAHDISVRNNTYVILLLE